MEYKCYKCKKVYTQNDLDEMEKKGIKKKIDGKPEGCPCRGHYVVCPECIPDPLNWIQDEFFDLRKHWPQDDKPPLIMTGQGTCKRCIY